MSRRWVNGRARTTVAVGALFCAANLLGACSDSDSGSSAGPTPSSSATPASEPAETAPAATPTAPSISPSDSPSPEVTATGPAPATGLEVTETRITVRAPEGWKLQRGGINKWATSAREVGGVGSFTVYDYPQDQPSTVEQEARDALRDGFDPGVKRIADTTLGGVPAYQLTQQGDGFPYTEIGTVHNGGDIAIQFEMSPLIEPAEQQAIIDSVLASVTWL
jgi:hypothetical protein